MVNFQPIERDEQSAEFFDAAAQGELMLRYSPSTGEWAEPAARFSPLSGAADLEWRTASGRGRVVSWTTKSVRSESGTDQVSYLLVELEEGPWLTLPLGSGTTESGIAVGQPVTVAFATVDNSEPQPVAVLGT